MERSFAHGQPADRSEEEPGEHALCCSGLDLRIRYRFTTAHQARAMHRAYAVISD
jgi:hypothetical protein